MIYEFIYSVKKLRFQSSSSQELKIENNSLRYTNFIYLLIINIMGTSMTKSLNPQIDQSEPSSQTQPEKVYLKKLKLNNNINLNDNKWTLINLDSTNNIVDVYVTMLIMKKTKIDQFQKFLDASCHIYALDLIHIHFTQGTKIGYCGYYVFGTLNVESNGVEILIYRTGSNIDENDINFDFGTTRFKELQETMKKNSGIITCQFESSLSTITQKIIEFNVEKNKQNLSGQQSNSTPRNIFEEHIKAYS